jgi:hypothetical protein
MCHAFEPMAQSVFDSFGRFDPTRFNPDVREPAHPDFRPILFPEGEMPTAPNLYNPIRREWIAGFLCPVRILSPDFYGNMLDNMDASNPRVGKINYVRLGDLQNEIDDAADLWGIEDALDQLIDFLLEGAQRDAPRDIQIEPLSEMQIDIWGSFSCATCHVTYDPRSTRVNAPDLRGFMSRQWMIDVIADPTTDRFYGPITATCVDRMPAYHPNAEDALMTMHEIEMLTDWLRGTWLRFPQAGGVPEVETVVPPVEETE